MARVRRYLKSQFGPRKIPFPDSLIFLEGIPFFAVAEFKEDDRRKRRVEFTLRSIKKIISETKEVKELRTKVKQLKSDNEEYKLKLEMCERDRRNKEAKVNLLETVNKNQSRKIEEMGNNQPFQRSPKNPLITIQERCRTAYPHLQAGSAGGGKKH